MGSAHSPVAAWPCGSDHLHLYHLLRVTPQPPSAPPTNSHSLEFTGIFCWFLKKKKKYCQDNLQKHMHDNSLPHFRNHIQDEESGLWMRRTWSSAVQVLNKNFGRLGLIIFPWKSTGVLSVLPGAAWCVWHCWGGKTPMEKGTDLGLCQLLGENSLPWNACGHCWALQGEWE